MLSTTTTSKILASSVIVSTAVAVISLLALYNERMKQQKRTMHQDEPEKNDIRTNKDIVESSNSNNIDTQSIKDEYTTTKKITHNDKTCTAMDYDVAPLVEIGGKDTTISTFHDDNDTTKSTMKKRILTKGCITIVHGSMTGTCAKFAKDLYDSVLQQVQQEDLQVHQRIVQLGSMEEWDWWDELLNDDNENESVFHDSNKHYHQHYVSNIKPVLVVLLPTYTNGTWPPSASALETTLADMKNDWRIEKQPLKKKLDIAVFGMGSSEYYDDTNGIKNMGQPAKDATRSFQKLGVKCITKLRIGDDAIGTNGIDMFHLWKTDLLHTLFIKNNNSVSQKSSSTDTTTNSNNPISSSTSTCCNTHKSSNGDEKCCSTKDTSTEVTKGGAFTTISHDDDDADTKEELDDYESDEEDDDDDYDDDDDDDDEQQEEPEVIDVEDMGNSMMMATSSKNMTNKNTTTTELPEMVTPNQAKALQKEGYKLIGTHSAVKLCRWTKHQLRGRGGCYKHTFYGITSYQCMEATPSLACANKCVFCWRHHKNPVGKEWRWKTDDPYYIVNEAIIKHIQMIKETKGIPGVQIDRWKDAHTVRHCALSLVGEPIMYPRIDEFIGELHRRSISSFLVTNGQHPSAIESLRPVTQLYVSVDAPTETSLIAIDRPLFNDAWDRLKQSLCSLKGKGQRTVARLTVVKGWNSDEVEGYARLIALGCVSLVEVKGVTFCGKSDASNLNMSNTPWHHEVVALTRTLKEELDKLRVQANNETDEIIPEYDLACEHVHSCSVLLARVDQFSEINPTTGQRKWKTWIDYNKFHILATEHAKDPSFTFTVQDYIADTPSWALFGANEKGFDPTDQRHRKKTKHPMYTQFDNNGIPTHDHDGTVLSRNERERLTSIMNKRMMEVGSGSVVTELKGGEKEIIDVALMFRGLVVTK